MIIEEIEMSFCIKKECSMQLWLSIHKTYKMI